VAGPLLVSQILSLTGFTTEVPGGRDSDRVPPRAAGDEEVPEGRDSDRVPPRAAGDEEVPGGRDSDRVPPRAAGDEEVPGGRDSDRVPPRAAAESDAHTGEDQHAALTTPRRSGRDRRPPSQWWKPTANVAATETEPSTFEEAMRSPSASAWKTAMETELASMRNLEVWSVIPRSEATRVIPCRWIFKVKRHADGTIERHKARLVAKGFKQRSGVDFDEVWAPVSRHATVRALLSTVARRGWEVDQIDVTTAFLYGDLEEDVFMEIVVNPVKDSIWLTSSGPATYIATGRPVRVLVCNAPSQHTETLVSTLLFSISAAS
jgi:hypothetical protein